MFKGTKLYSIFNFKCPVCHQGDFFVSNNPYNLKYTGKLKEECTHCHVVFQKETGFYFGAMYVSYALGVAIFITCYIAFNVLFPEISMALLFFSILGILTLLGPLLHALSKIIWANIFMHYQKSGGVS